MAKVTGSKTTKAAEAASLRAARTKHRVGVGQLFIQPTAHADREAALLAAAEKVDQDFPSKAQVDDYQAEVAAIDFITGPAPVEAQAAVSHVRPTAPYVPASRTAPVGETMTVQVWDKVNRTAREFTIAKGPAFATLKQANWMLSIAANKVLPSGATLENLLVRLEQGFAKAAASQFLSRYKDLPDREVAPAAPAAPAPVAKVEVPAGRYALRGADGVVKFYRLDKPTKGRWAGWTFLKVQASDDLYAIRNRVEKDRIIAEISKDVEGALCLYGQELGVCGDCGRTLTDETSRKIGRGPICRNK